MKTLHTQAERHTQYHNDVAHWMNNDMRIGYLNNTKFYFNKDQIAEYIQPLTHVINAAGGHKYTVYTSLNRNNYDEYVYFDVVTLDVVKEVK